MLLDIIHLHGIQKLGNGLRATAYVGIGLNGIDNGYNWEREIKVKRACYLWQWDISNISLLNCQEHTLAAQNVLKLIAWCK